ncbi:integrase core domain protein [Ancylostoma ceylanicum]|uniref:Integrase core domain protein n=1 Tax=Ancylostoma ceylanicum TaxID=53326 RepID=A0A0D6L4Y5_9BILA|nr:integrase core domain protein [Ancylostoma ceylanicum]
MATVRSEYWIPRLRQKARNLVQKCVRCRRFNASPYSYPAMPDLPARRVQQCRPFQHIGLDFFDLPNVRDGDSSSKAYGCIFTCAVTRLIHLEVVTSMGTTAFLNALRRFFSRRGIPSSITCDNAPTFLLSAEILAHVIDNAESLPLIANNKIEWRHITAYAPWQGGFYERLIKSIKHSLYKTLGKIHLDLDSLITVVTEIEASLNTRPLTYQEAELEQLTTLRPIDFIQKDMVVTYPFDAIGTDAEDPDYQPATAQGAIQTRKQAEEALQSSYATTQKVWQTWHSEYLLSLREQHRKWLSSARNNPAKPHEGAVVLLMDPILPRNEWRLARIVEARAGTDGVVREAKLRTATGRIIRRPINLIVPLELECVEVCNRTCLQARQALQRHRITGARDTTSASDNK